MSIDSQTNPPAPEPRPTPPSYEAPQILRLGTVADLTQGGEASEEPDGYGYAGASGSI